MIRSFLSRVRSAVTSSGARFVSASTALTDKPLGGALVVVRYVAPPDLGLWQSVRLAQVYSVFVLAGILNGLNQGIAVCARSRTSRMRRTVSLKRHLLFTNLAALLALVAGSVGIFTTVSKGWPSCACGGRCDNHRDGDFLSQLSHCDVPIQQKFCAVVRRPLCRSGSEPSLAACSLLLWIFGHAGTGDGRCDPCCLYCSGSCVPFG